MDDHGQSTLTELSGHIEACNDVSVRFVLSTEGERRVLHTLVADAIPHSGTPERAVYDYGAVIFLVDTVPGKKISEWLSARKGEHHGYAFEIPELQQSVPWDRYPSHTRYGFLGLPLPFTEYQANTASMPGSQNTNLAGIGYLAADDCPFFPDYRTAAFELLYRAMSVQSQWQLPNQLASVRIAHAEAWIERVHFSPTSVSVAIEGNDVGGTRLEIVGPPDLRWDATPLQPGAHNCPLLNGIPEELWIVLSRHGVRLDYRYLNRRWRQAPFSPTVENVTEEVGGIDSRIEELLYRGEGETIEFKREVPNAEDRLLKTVAAFANGEGGVILVGVDDDGTVPGVDRPLNQEKDRIINMIRAKVDPGPPVRLEDGKVNGKDVIAIFVDQGDSPPYCLYPAKPEPYVRRGATTFRARQEEIRALGQRGATQTTQQGRYPR